MKLFKAAWLILGLFALTAAGCDLYFDSPDQGGYVYCDESGCYRCYDDGTCVDDAEWPEPGSECSANSDCAPGCYCSGNNTCEESGFCESGFDCWEGESCDSRDTCVPGEGSGCTSDANCPMGSTCDIPTGYCIVDPLCTEDADCETGSYCDEETGACESAGTCSTDEDCAEGFECDESRTSCMPDDGLCESNDECGTGQECDLADTQTCVDLTCEDISDEQTCFERQDCAPLYRGINCTDPNGNLCSEAQSNCTCESFAFQSCATAAAP